jgi:hypothetical protein
MVRENEKKLIRVGRRERISHRGLASGWSSATVNMHTELRLRLVVAGSWHIIVLHFFMREYRRLNISHSNTKRWSVTEWLPYGKNG